MPTYWNLTEMPGYTAASTQPSPYPIESEQFQYDPEKVGKGISQYYGTALAAQPGYEEILRNIQGVVSPQVRNTISQAAAERGVGIGSYGGANDATALLRALGLTSQDLSNKGLEQYRAAYSTVPGLTPTALFIPPSEQAGMNLQWLMQQSEQAAAAQRQREATQAQEALARIQQATQMWSTNQAANLRMWESEQNRLAAERARSSTANALAALGQRYGTAEYGVPTFSTGAGATGGSVLGGISSAASTPLYGTGGYYAGSKLPSYTAEERVLAGLSTPADYGATAAGYVPGNVPAASDAWVNDFLNEWEAWE